MRTWDQASDDHLLTCSSFNPMISQKSVARTVRALIAWQN